MTPLGLALTKLYTSVSEKFGKDIAEDLTTYVKEEISSEVDIKTTHLATKEDVAKVETQIAHLRGEFKEEIAHVKGELKEEISNVKGELKEEIAHVRTEIAHVKSDLIKWMVGIFITLVVMILGLYGTMIFFFIQSAR